MCARVYNAFVIYRHIPELTLPMTLNTGNDIFLNLEYGCMQKIMMFFLKVVCLKKKMLFAKVKSATAVERMCSFINYKCAIIWMLQRSAALYP